MQPLYGHTISDRDTGVTAELSLADLFDIKVNIASKTEESISDAPGVISVITRDELQRFGGTTLADILKRVPSFLASTNYMSDRSMVAARGDQLMPSASHSLLLINGRPVREIFFGGSKSEVYESFPVNIIDRIEVIRGPGSVLYGSQAFTSVINVITRCPQENAVSVSGSLGEHFHKKVSGDLQIRKGDFGMTLAGRYADKGDWDVDWKAPGLTKVYSNPISIPDFGPGVYADIEYRDFFLMCSYNQWQNQSFLPDRQFFRDIPSIGISDVTSKVTWRKLFGDLGYSFKPADWYHSTVNATFTESWLSVRKFPKTSRYSYEVLGEWTNFITPFERCNIILGGAAGFMTGEEGDTDHDTAAYHRGVYNKGHRGLNFNGYLQADYRLDWLKIIGGLQVNKVRYKDSTGKVDNFKPDFNPRAGLIFYPLEHINIKALYSTAYRAPSFTELYLDYLVQKGKMIPQDTVSWYPGHTYNLDPEKVNTIDLGATYQDNTVEFSINGFYSSMKSMIIQRAISPTMTIYDNLSEIVLYGLECDGKYYLTKSLLFEGSMLFQQSRDKNTGEIDMAPLPDFSAKGGVSYRSDFGLVISGFNTFQQALNPKYASRYNTTTGSFNMTNLHCSYDFNTLFHWSRVTEWLLVVDVDNLFDREVWLPCWGRDLGYTIPYNEGRTIYGGFTVTF